MHGLEVPDHLSGRAAHGHPTAGHDAGAENWATIASLIETANSMPLIRRPI